MLKSRVLALLPLFVVAGCISLPKPPQFDDSMSQTWTESMARYHLNAVFPASSDIHVGDVYYFLNCNTKYLNGKPDQCANINGRPGTMSTKAGYQDPNAYLNEYYSKVPEVVLNAKDASGHAWAAPTFDRVVDFNLLPRVALPAFSGTTSGSVAGGASLPAQFLSVVFGGASRRSLAYTVSFRDVRTYGLPVLSSLDLLSQFCGQVAARCDIRQVQEALLLRLATTGNDLPFIGIIDRVYVTKSITFTFGRDVASAVNENLVVNLQHSLTYQNEGHEVRQTIDGAMQAPDVAGAATTTAPTSAASTTGAANAMSGTADEQAKSVEDRKAPGETVHATLVKNDSIVLEQTFDKPVVIAYGVTFAPLGGGAIPDQH